MTRDEAGKIFYEMSVMFPDILRGADDKSKVAKTWINKLIKGDYEKTKARLSDYAYNNRFPPKLADIVVVPHEYIDPTETQIYKARQQVAKEKADPVLREKRQRVIQQFQEKMRGMAAYDSN